jgi:NAD(P)-dependent dehydrogenase (short-subunit alcohol dehydrogenase family)
MPTSERLRESEASGGECGEGQRSASRAQSSAHRWPEATAYAAAKSGLISMVRTLGRELAPEQIIVNAVAPGFTDTPQLQVDADQ